MKMIRERNKKRYLEYFNGRRNVLDIGCGRGEFLDVLKDNGIHAVGVDANEDMIKLCQNIGLEAYHDDAINYLETIDDNTLDGIIITQMIEHAEPAYIFDLLKLCHHNMTHNAIIITETINIATLNTIPTFFKDPTHIRPVHPDTLKFILEQIGFKDIQLQFYEKTEGLKLLPPQDEKAKIINDNIEKLNNILFGYQDYTAIGIK
jgi:O-antigen chain-terminating methyltransferase